MVNDQGDPWKGKNTLKELRTASGQRPLCRSVFLGKLILFLEVTRTDSFPAGHSHVQVVDRVNPTGVNSFYF